MPERLAMGAVTAPEDIVAWERVRSRLGGGRIDPATGRRIGVGVPALVAFPPEVYPTKESVSFIRSATATVGPGPTALTVVVPAFQIPTNTLGVIREITLTVNNLLLTSAIVFSLRFNQGPVPGYDQMVIAPRVAASVSVVYDPNSTLIRVPDSATVDIAVVVTDAVAYQMTATFRGWHYPKDTVSSW